MKMHKIKQDSITVTMSNSFPVTSFPLGPLCSVCISPDCIPLSSKSSFNFEVFLWPVTTESFFSLFLPFPGKTQRYYSNLYNCERRNWPFCAINFTLGYCWTSTALEGSAFFLNLRHKISDVCTAKWNILRGGHKQAHTHSWNVYVVSDKRFLKEMIESSPDSKKTSPLKKQPSALLVTRFQELLILNLDSSDSTVEHSHVHPCSLPLCHPSLLIHFSFTIPPHQFYPHSSPVLRHFTWHPLKKNPLILPPLLPLLHLPPTVPCLPLPLFCQFPVSFPISPPLFPSSSAPLIGILCTSSCKVSNLTDKMAAVQCINVCIDCVCMSGSGPKWLQWGNSSSVAGVH